MGTRSLTYFFDHDYPDRAVACMYRQMDGYPSGHGQELAKFLDGIIVVNGFGTGDAAGTHANGIGCLAAQVVAHFKNDQGIGGIYLEPSDSADGWTDYVYRVDASAEHGITLSIYESDNNDPLIESAPAEVLEWINNQKQEN